MSVYCHRIYEVKVPIIDQYLNSVAKEIPMEAYLTGELHDGYTIRVWNQEKPYLIWNEKKGEWEWKNKCKHKWVLVRSLHQSGYGYNNDKYDVVAGDVISGRTTPYSDYTNIVMTKTGDKFDEFICYCDNGGIIRDEFINPRGIYSYHEDSDFADRGLPDDVSEEAKKYVEHKMGDYSWGLTYVTLEEWDKVYQTRFEKFKNDLKDTYQKINYANGVEQKIEELYSVLVQKKEPKKKAKKRKKENGEYTENYEDTLKYLWEEDFSDIMSIRSEIAKAYNFTEAFGYVSSEDLRIIYYLS